MDLHIATPCPKCHKPIAIATIALHPDRPGLALHNFNCAACGPVMTKVLPIAPERTARAAVRTAARHE
jgi:hypothetical protein